MHRIFIALAVGLSQFFLCVPTLAADKGVLILEVKLNEQSSIDWMREFAVMNIVTKQWVVQRSPDRHPLVEELDEGIYCVYSIKSYDNVDVTYCGEPYFKVIAGKVNNAGLWTMYLHREEHAKFYWTVDSATADLAGTLSRARLYSNDDRALIEKYSSFGK